jgi:hypothetical protein
MPGTPQHGWGVEFTPQADRWFKGLRQEDANRIAAGMSRLREKGPTLGRPWVDSIKGARHHNMKELRSRNIRVLFVFGPHQAAVMLVGGDKTGDWKGWYKRNIRQADRLYDQYLHSIGKGEASRRPSSRRAGRPSEERGR